MAMNRASHRASHPGWAGSAFLFLLLPLALLSFGCGDGTDDGDPSESAPTSAAAPKLDPTPPPLPIFEGFGDRQRLCGLDLDDDGIVGEPEDCRLCDGSTADPDGDGVDEDLIYVDCQAGTDSADCGTPENPCASIAHAWGVRADGPADGAEDIVCFRGTCRPSEPIQPSVAGVAGVVTVPAAGAAARDFERATDPTMLVGWDSDADGEYPPLDKDDVAVIDAWELEESPEGAAGETEPAAKPSASPPANRAFRLDARNDRLEMAHFTVRGHGTFSESKKSGFLELGPSQGSLEHVELHDLHLVDINRARVTSSEVSTVSLFTGKTRVSWLWMHDIWAPRNGGWFVRGPGSEVAVEGQDAGPFRFEHLAVTAQGCDFDHCQQGASFTAFHLWGYLSGIEILSSDFDANVGAWQPKPKGGPTGARFALVAQCSRDWTIRHNRIRDFKNALRVQGWAERYCDNEKARTVDDVLFDRNRVENSYAPWASGDMAIYVSEGGDDPAETVEDLTITHNVLSSPVGWEACIWIDGGNEASTPPGRIVVANNTCMADIDYHGAIVVGDTAGRVSAHRHARIELRNNLVTGLGSGDPVLRFTYVPGRLVLDNNRYDPLGVYSWQGEDLADLAAWQQATGADTESRACLPDLEDPETGQLAPTASDTCTQGGAVIEGVPAHDFDGASRPSEGAWAVGAYEPR